MCIYNICIGFPKVPRRFPGSSPKVSQRFSEGSHKIPRRFAEGSPKVSGMFSESPEGSLYTVPTTAVDGVR